MDKQFNFQELHAIVSTLRSENGCPWDRAQTHETIKGNTIEEAYEVNQAVTDLSETGDPANLCEELGDLLLQVMLHSQIAEENGEFTLEDVVDGIARKMIRRHPHVFGQTTYHSIEEQQADWDAIKAQEHGSEGGEAMTPADELKNVPAAFPALVPAPRRSRAPNQKGSESGRISCPPSPVRTKVRQPFSLRPGPARSDGGCPLQ